jgi:hypothetical protein
MISPDTIPVWFFIPAFVVLMVAWIVVEIRNAPVDPDPRWSQLDCWDGLDSRTD